MEKKNKHLGSKPKDNTCGDVPSTNVGCNDDIRRLGKLGDGTRGSFAYEHKLRSFANPFPSQMWGKKTKGSAAFCWFFFVGEPMEGP